MAIVSGLIVLIGYHSSCLHRLLKDLSVLSFLCQPDAARIIAIAAKFKIVLEKSVDRPCRLRCVVRRQTVGRIGYIPVLS